MITNWNQHPLLSTQHPPFTLFQFMYSTWPNYSYAAHDLIIHVWHTWPNFPRYSVIFKFPTVLRFSEPGQNEILSPILIQIEPSTQIFIISNYFFDIICLGGLKKKYWSNLLHACIFIKTCDESSKCNYTLSGTYRYYSIKAKAIKN